MSQKTREPGGGGSEMLVLSPLVKTLDQLPWVIHFMEP